MAESVPLDDLETDKKSKSCRYFKMQVLDNHSGESITKVVQESIDEKSIVFTDMSSSYICKYVEVHLKKKSNTQVTKET